MNKLDLNTFKRDNSFYGELNLLLTVKSFELKKIRERYLASKKNNNSKVGSVERREKARGGIIEIKIKDGSVLYENKIIDCVEPRGIDLIDTYFAFSSENKVFIVDENKINVIQDDWFSYIHTVKFSPCKKNILISSSGFDVIFEFDVFLLSKKFEWFAWENGFNKSVDKNNKELFLTKDEKKAKAWERDHINFKLIKTPNSGSLPTALRAAFINSVNYNNQNSNQLLATLFHKGAVCLIDKKTKRSQIVLDGLSSPHGGKAYENEFMATSTASGEVVLGNQIYSFTNLEGKLASLANLEWIQNTINRGDLFISIDSNRNSFIIFDIKNKLIDIVPFNDNWAIQDLIFGKLKPEKIKLLDDLQIPMN